MALEKIDQIDTSVFIAKFLGPRPLRDRLIDFWAVSKALSNVRSSHLVIDFSGVSRCDYVDIEEAVGHDEIAVWLSAAGVRRVTLISGCNDVMAPFLVRALRSQRIKVEDCGQLPIALETISENESAAHPRSISGCSPT